MGASGSFPVDLILFGMIAAFLVLRLRSILGKRQGFERPPQAFQPATDAARGTVIDGRAESPAAAPARPLPDPASPLGQTLARMRGAGQGFDPVGFLTGSEAAFRMIVEAYASGDRVTLRNLLSDDIYRPFEQAIAEREAAGQTQRTEVKAINAATIEAADLRGSVAHVAVRFVSDQVSLTTAKDGAPVQGTDAVTEITDLWTFERDLASSDPSWRLIEARSA